MAIRSASSSGSFQYQVRRDPYAHSGPVPLPEVINDDSEASWALWREATNTPSNWEADTVPMDLAAE